MNLIHSLLDNDLYKFTMAQGVLHQFSNVNVEYAFKCRNKDIQLSKHLEDKLAQEIAHLCSLKFSGEELKYLRTIPFLKTDFVDFLENYTLKERYVSITNGSDGLSIRINGPWLQTIFFEVPILAIVNELYFKDTTDDIVATYNIGRRKLSQKLDLIKNIPGFKFSDFGTRRRFSLDWHNDVMQTLKDCPNCIGTSNVYFAKQYNMKAMGTMAHEWIMVGQGLDTVRLSESQKYMLDAWVKEYRGNLGIALSDTLGRKAFFHDFDLFFSKLYDGCRHDSGDPYNWCDQLLKHYEEKRIDARTKSAIFSDGLDFTMAANIYNAYKDKINVSFGIGTNLTNDLVSPPLNIVIKLVKVNGRPVAKLSDTPGKVMCEDEQFINYLRKVYNIERG